MTKVDVVTGVCGFRAQIEAQADEAFNVNLVINSDCPRVSKLAGPLAQVAPLDDMRKPMNETAVYVAASACKLHAACPVPCAIHKAIEVAAGLALPSDVSIEINNS